MQRLLTLFAVMMLTVFSISDAEAKKLGSGKSFGKSYQTAPAQPPAAKTPDAANPAAAAAPGAAAAAGAKKGLLGGLLGGLLVGGLVAAMFGGAFEGIQLMDILILAALAFIAFKLFRRRATQVPQQAAYTGAAGSVPVPQPAPVAQREGFVIGGGGAARVPFNLPAGFDVARFVEGAREHYGTLQDAWNRNDLEKIREYVSPELFAHLSAERAALSGEQHTEVTELQAELVRAEQVPGRAELSVKFSGRYRDTVEGIEEPITDIWHLERDLTTADAPWIIVGIEA